MTPPDNTNSMAPPHAEAAVSAAVQAAGLVAVIFDPATGAVVGLEGRAPDGGPGDLLPDFAQALAAANTATLESIVQDAFEAGIACVLGAGQDAARKGDEPGAENEAELRGLLLSDLIANSAARGLMGREVLNRAMLATIFSNLADARGAAAAVH